MRHLVLTMLTFVLSVVIVANMTSAYENQSSPQQKKTTQKKAESKAQPSAKKTTSTPQKPIDEWDSLDKQRKIIIAELGALKKKFDISSRKNKITIRDEYQKLIDRWSKELEPRMSELSFAIWENKPTDELAKKLAFNSIHYEQLAKTIDRMIVANVDLKTSDRKSIYQLGAEAHFDIHNFDRAKDLLDKADEAKTLSPFNGGTDLQKTVNDYIDFWKEELAIRQKEALAKDEDKNPHVEIVTNKGSIVVELFENQAPNTVKNFINLVELKKYDGTLFYQQTPKYPVFGGDLLDKKDPTKNEALGYTIECECYREDARRHFRGSLTMSVPTGQGKDSGGSEFALLRTPYPFWNPVKESPNSKGRGNTVFGRVVSGMDLVDRLVKGDVIMEAKVLSKRNHPYVPYTSADLEKEKKQKAEKEDAKKDAKTDSKKESKEETKKEKKK